ncbi:MAG: sigma-54-dependent Fis family transcriptional regulator [Spirochaetales bacterium]|nr:sigma-54-dependent Fis family transcriptional regulator [Spirochaetales bacterium]
MNMKTIFPLDPLLLVDDEEDVLESYKMALKFNGINNFILCSDSREVPGMLAERKISVAVLDLFMPHVKGQDLLSLIKEKYPQIPVIVVTGSNKVETAVECMKCGAFDYMVKPVENSRLTSSIRTALEIRELQFEVDTLKRQVLSQDIHHPEVFAEIITTANALKSIFKYAEAIACTPKPVLVTGESGVGKELIARAIHRLSNRTGNFVPVNVGGLDDTMFSDTLFGHKKGAFTGADSSRPGLIEQASGGTLFLDEIGDMDNTSQVKLLRLLQDKEYYPLGSDVVKISDARIIAATNTDLEQKQNDNTFRNDLYYRLIIHHIHMPPLRERPEDIPLLINHFVEQSAQSMSRKTPGIPDQIFPLLSSYHFPGNIRELQSMIYDAVSRCETPVLSLSVFKEYIKKRTGGNAREDSRTAKKDFSISYSGRIPTLKEAEDFFIEKALERAKGNQSIAATYLGINQSTLSRRLKEKQG